MNLINFDNVVFDGKLVNMPTIFNSMQKNSYIPSKYYEERYRKGVVVRTMDIIYDVLRMYKGTYPNVGAYCAETKKGYIAEIQYKNGDVSVINILKKRDGSYYCKASVIDENDVCMKFIINNENKSLVMLGLMPLILADQEAADIYSKMSDFLEWSSDANDWLYNDHINEFAQLLNVFSSNVEARLSFSIPEQIKINTDTISMLKLAELKVDITKEYAGIGIKFFTDVKLENTEIKTENADFEGKYAYSQRGFTDEEKKLVAKLSKGYVMPDFVPEICNFFQKSSSFPSPMRVAYLIGPAGTGKTEGANAICTGLGLPMDHYTCNPNTEIFDFIGQVFPNGNDTALSYEEIRRELGLPSTEDIVNDPANAYEVMYGTKPNGIPDEGKIIVDMIKKVMDYISQLGSGKAFTYVESGLIKAARCGYGFEIQEIGCVLRPGVAVGLNALLETGQNSYITLPTGEVIKKHPECTFIFTSNDAYEGCCNLNQSVLDRMSLVYRIPNPPKEVMKERILSRLNFPSVSILNRMVDVIYNISSAAKEKDITDGVCGYRALENWAMAVMITAMDSSTITDAIVYQTAIMTVMNKASQNEEYVQELMSCLTCQFAAPNNI